MAGGARVCRGPEATRSRRGARIRRRGPRLIRLLCMAALRSTILKPRREHAPSSVSPCLPRSASSLRAPRGLRVGAAPDHLTGQTWTRQRAHSRAAHRASVAAHPLGLRLPRLPRRDHARGHGGGLRARDRQRRLVRARRPKGCRSGATTSSSSTGAAWASSARNPAASVPATAAPSLERRSRSWRSPPWRLSPRGRPAFPGRQKLRLARAERPRLVDAQITPGLVPSVSWGVEQAVLSAALVRPQQLLRPDRAQMFTTTPVWLAFYSVQRHLLRPTPTARLPRPRPHDRPRGRGAPHARAPGARRARNSHNEAAPPAPGPRWLTIVTYPGRDP